MFDAWRLWENDFGAKRLCYDNAEHEFGDDKRLLFEWLVSRVSLVLLVFGSDSVYVWEQIIAITAQLHSI